MTILKNTFGVFTIIPLLALSMFTSSLQAEFKDPLELPAVEQKNPLDESFIGSAREGNVVVVVGPVGLIVTSADAGESWRQAQVPVQSDLVAVDLVSESKGWAVGHDGVILATGDGGMTWTKQLDGVMAGELFASYYEKLIQQGDVQAVAALETTELNYRDGPALPYLDVWFRDESIGFVVGAFGNIARTDDGGETWVPWTHRIDNEDGLHLNSVAGVGDNVFIGSERGTLFKLNDEGSTFEIIETGYAGSFTGITGDEGQVVAYGLQGASYRSTDEGENWQVVTELPRSTINNAFRLDNDRGFVFANQSGGLVFTDRDFSSFDVFDSEESVGYTSVVELADQEFMVTTLQGIKMVSLSDHKTVKPKAQESDYVR